MRFLGRSPGIHNLVVLIKDFKCCTRKFFLIGDILFGDCHITVWRIKHLHVLDFHGVLHLELDCLGNFIIIWSRNLSKSIFTDWKFLNVMRFLGGSPLFYDFVLLIFNNQVCPRDLLAICDVLFGDCYFCDFISHNNRHYCVICFAGLNYLKGNCISSCVAICRFFLC